MITAAWSNDCEALADRLFQELGKEKESNPADVLTRRHCVVVPNRIRQHWLQHRCLLDHQGAAPRVLANIDFPLLNIFVNDWLHRMTDPGGDRDPSGHPFSTAALTWRILRLLEDEQVVGLDSFQPLVRYVEGSGDGHGLQARRRFALAARLGRLFDEYQVYRPATLLDWERGGERDAEDPASAWQPEMWRQLSAGPARGRTYLAAFLRMHRDLVRCGIDVRYRKIHVFGISQMPRAYTVFFDVLSQQLPVCFYVFNPCREPWDDALTGQELERVARDLRLQGIEEQDALLEAGSPLLSSMGRGCRDFLGEVVDITEGQIDDLFREDPAPTLLGHLKRSLFDNRTSPPPETCRNDQSVQLHVCHSPMREVEVLRDHLLRWFTEMPGLQPRHVQVQVTDMAVYAPLIRAVFSTQAHLADTTIPFVIADRVLGGETRVAEAFMQLLELPDGRFTAPEVMDLLQCDSVRNAFGLGEGDLDLVQAMVADSGVRWGRDADHRRRETGVEFTESTTWRNGLDRLFLGYAFAGDHESALGVPVPCDLAEGESANVLGRLARFVDALNHEADRFVEQATPTEWAERLAGLLDTFFRETNETYQEIGLLRGVLDHFRCAMEAAEFDQTLSLAVVRDALRSPLQSAIGGEDLIRNAVVFSALRAGSSVPRRILCMLGMGDGQFPRADARPAYDLLRRNRRRGDRSTRTEDRLACLEALTSARERLYLSYVGRTLQENEVIPPSTVVNEILDETGQPPSVTPCEHRLQPFHPAYFRDGSHLFSYHGGNCYAARRIVGRDPGGQGGAGERLSRDAPEVESLDLADLLRFFRNPARAFYRETLGVFFEPTVEGQVPDREEFVPSGLVRYAVGQDVARAVVSGETPASLYRRLSETGKLPLGCWGKTWFGAEFETISGLLSTPVYDGLLLEDLLRLQEASDPVPLQADAAGIAVSGRAAFATDPAGRTLVVDFRYARDKATDCLASWLGHLLVCASGFPATRLYVARGGKDDLATVVWPAMPEDQAAERLGVLLHFYRQGLSCVPPFTPSTSYAYTERWRSPKKGKADRHEQGLAQARRAWDVDSGPFAHGDAEDVYYRTAFGPEGPFALPGFVEVSKQVFEPLLDAAAEGEA